MNELFKPTMLLAKKIKLKKLDEFLSKALSALPKDSIICAYLDKNPIARQGQQGQLPSVDKTISVPVKNNDKIDLLIGADISDKNNPTVAANVKAVVELTAFSISEYMESETARKIIGAETLAKYRELALLHRSIVELNNSLRLKDVIHALLTECMTSTLPAEIGAVYLPDECGFTIFDHFGEINDKTFTGLVNSPLFIDIITGLRGEIVNEVSSDPRCDSRLDKKIKSLLIMPIPSPNACEGALILASSEENSFKAAHLKHVSTLSSVAGISISNSYNFESIRVLMDALLKALAEAIDARDPFTAGHSERVAHLAVAFAQVIDRDTDEFRDCNFSDEQLREIFYSGILHDIGKIGIKEEVLTKNSRLPKRVLDLIGLRMKLFGLSHKYPWEDSYNRLKQINLSLNPCREDLDFVDTISNMTFSLNGTTVPLLHPDERKCLMVKKGNLTAEERTEIERHPAESQRILEHIPFQDDFSQLLTIIRQHHERLDGSGYPDGIKDAEILLQSRMLAIADIFDAVTQERHYKPATPRDRALRILSEEAYAGKLDAKLVKLFINKIDEIENGMDSINLDHPASTRFCKIPRRHFN